MSDSFLSLCLKTLALGAAAVTLAIFVFLFWQSAPLLNQVGISGFFNSQVAWAPTHGEYNLWPMVAGTFWVTLGALVLAVPLGLGLAIFQEGFAPRPLASTSHVLVGVMAGIPSVVFGLWGLSRVAPLINQWRAPGLSLLAGILILALMILPTVVLTASAALAAVSPAVRSGARALGLGPWTSYVRIILPAARPGIVVGILLALGRALGETMAVIMVMGNTVLFPHSPFDAARTLTATVALEMAYALGAHRQALFATGFFLLMVATVVVAVTHRLKSRMS